MSLLVLEDLKKHFGAQEVLSGASLRIDPGEKIGLVGRNGSGKTTLLRLIEELDHPDWGRVRLRKGARLGHVPQRPQFERGLTVRAYVEGGLAEVHETIAEYEQTTAAMGTADGEELERLMKQHDFLAERIEVLGGWEADRHIETVLSGIGLAPEFWEREAETLSGGEKSRAALARVLVAGHDLLLLDEPTNHLDLDGIEWIENYIREIKGALLVVSHDRRLLENVVGAIVELERGKLTRYPGNYSRYLQLKEEHYLADLRAYEEQQDFIRKEDAFIKKHMGSQRVAEAKGRLKRLKSLERLERPFHDVRRPVIRAPKAGGGDRVVEATDVTAGYDGKTCFTHANVRVGRGQRVGIVGANGAGKSTFLRILAGRAAPLAGHATQGHGARCGFYDQETGELRADSTPFQEIRIAKPNWTELEIRSHLARFLFRGDEVEKTVSALSGGERARLALAKLVLTEPTWLALDEPTNHLDLAGRTALEEMLGEYQGAIVCVSHDRAFLDGLCDHIVEVSGGRVREFPGNYSAYRAARSAEEDATRAVAEKRAAEEKARRRAQEEKARATAKKSPKKESSGGKVRNPYMFEKLEKRIIALEEELAKLNASMAEEDVYRDPDRLREMQYRIAEVERDLATANAEWESWE